MFTQLFSFIHKIKNKNFFNNVYKLLENINDLEKKFINISDYNLKRKTYELSFWLSSGYKTLSDILPIAFAVVIEATKRVMGIRHFEVQVIGGIILSQGYIVEMKTGEGKTLTSTLPIYLYALYRKGVHVVTVNNYLAKRDSEYNGVLFNFLGLSVGLNLSDISFEEKKSAYLADITYGISNEYVFDYLRDHMVFSNSQKVQRGLFCALIDEIDFVLIDEARTPLIISDTINNNSNTAFYFEINKFISFLKKSDKNMKNGDFVIDRKNNHIFFTEKGLRNLENLLILNKLIKKNSSLFHCQNIKIIYYVISLLKAYYLYVRDVNYIIKNNKVVIIDENTGRIMFDRRWSEGIHQAIEAKENIKIENESFSLSSITFQNYFRLYKKLSGMTGTALTESSEFSYIYNIDTISIPTHKLMIRKDLPDLIYLTKQEKFNAIINDIVEKHKQKRPVLVGTVSIKSSELISLRLSKLGIKHNVLNAKFDVFEADIISQAGLPSAITIATNMAGRGTDIILGGNYLKKIKGNNSRKFNLIKKIWQKKHDFVIKKGGLYVIGTERHESRRIDNQLRGRCGRQGDPGSSIFYVSLEDSLIKVFLSSKIKNFIRNMGINYGECIQHPLLILAIEKIQEKVENKNFMFRKKLLYFDNVVDHQREIIFTMRNNILINSYNIFYCLLNKIVKLIFLKFSSKKLNYILIFFINNFKINIDINIYKNKNITQIQKIVFNKLIVKFNKKKTILGEKIIKVLIKNIMLKKLDYFWEKHLSIIEYFKEGSFLYSYAQKSPLHEYKIQTSKIFLNILDKFYIDVIKEFFFLNSTNYLNYLVNNDI